MSRIRGHDHDHENGFPRVSGDEPALQALDAPERAFSPRERG